MLLLSSIYNELSVILKVIAFTSSYSYSVKFYSFSEFSIFS